MLSYTLVPDGPSDRALIPILDWLIQQYWDGEYESSFGEYLGPLSAGLAARVRQALRLYPCNLLFVHRDAERQSTAVRMTEIENAMRGSAQSWVPVIPVRMTEAWLLSDPDAIRAAADNPRGRQSLHLPRTRSDRLPNPKAVLTNALVTASGLSERRRERFLSSDRRVRVAELTMTFAPLRLLPAFRELEDRIRASLANIPLVQ